MQNKSIEHPFRTISFDFDETKAWTVRDEKLLHTYLALHDHVSQLQDEAAGLLTRFGEADAHIATMRKELNRVKKKISAVRDAADRITTLPAPDALTKFSASVHKTHDAILQFHGRMQGLEEEIQALHALKENYTGKEEDDSLWERMMELRNTYSYDNRLSIDLGSFDAEEESFRSRAGFAREQNEKHIDFCNGVVENYNRLLLETTAQYDLWNEFGKRVQLIERLTGMQTGLGDIGLN